MQSNAEIISEDARGAEGQTQRCCNRESLSDPQPAVVRNAHFEQEPVVGVLNDKEPAM